MSVTSTTATGSTLTTATSSIATAAAKTSTLDYNSFLQLLTAQMKNQDPTKPMDSTAFVSQLASFSSVEQQVNTNSRLDAILTSSNLSQAGSMIGMKITSADGTVSGIIKEIHLLTSGSEALLADGRSVQISDGISLSLP